MADNKNSTLSFYSNCMIESAQSLQRVSKELDKSEFGKIETDTHLFSGTNLSMPILMSFAIEVALIVMADSNTGEKICFPHS